MLSNKIFYIVETKTSKCSCCGKTIKNIYKYDGKDYGYYCFMQAIGKPIDKTTSKEKPLPSWIFDLMNDYIEKKKNRLENNIEDFEVNFWNELHGKLECPNDGSVYLSSVKINNKRIPVYWQYKIMEYLHMRYNSIKNNIGTKLNI